jgi:putative adenylate-forming enzyme
MGRLLELILIAFHFAHQRWWRKFSSRGELRRWQERRLDKLLRFVRRRSPFYAGRLRSPWTATIPIDKQIMMDHFDSLNTRGLKRDQALAIAIHGERTRDFAPMLNDVTVGLSSGTSGQRGLFCADFRERCAYAGTILAKALPEWGWLKRNRVALFMRANSNLYGSVQNGRMQFQFFDLLEPLASHIEGLGRLQPTLLIGPPSLLRQLADAVDAGVLALNSLDRIYSVAEVLDPLDEMILQRVFHRKIHQIYQCTEGFLAISCRHGHLHLNEDLVIVEKEWLDEGDGKFVPIITDLNRRTQPIIRYRLNDILTEERQPCPCGSVFTRLKMIEGRCDDLLYFHSPQGERKSVYPDFVRNAILYASSDIREFRVEQWRDAHLRIAIEGLAPLPYLQTRVRLEIEGLANRLDCTPPEIEFVDYIRPVAGQKLRRVIRSASTDHLQ